jgi:hypothetical protein
MRFILAGATLLTTLAIGGPVPAQDDEILGIGRCAVSINDRVVAQRRECPKVVVRHDRANGRLTLDFDFADGFDLQISGPAVAAGPGAYSLMPDQLTYANPGQTNPVTHADEPGQTRFRGRCDVRWEETGRTLTKISCDLSTPIGRMGVGYGPFRPPKKRPWN